MGMQTFKVLNRLVAIMLLFVVLPGVSVPAIAQDSELLFTDRNDPPEISGRPGDTELQRDTAGIWYMPAGAGASLDATVSGLLQASGGPDDFGYTWSDAVDFNWIDATVGTVTDLGGSTYVVGPIALPFSFKFYEHTYSQIYISKYGYIGFNNLGLTTSQGRIPSPATPNNIIAPYWVPALVNESGYTGRVYFMSGGTFPNRYFVIQWDQIRGNYLPEQNIYTFQVILHENADIVFQYATMSYGSGYSCGQAGIEDALGWDGLAYGSFCQRYASDRAIRFYRPPPSARVNIPSLHQGQFARPGATVDFNVSIRNTGEFGSDVYDLFVSSPWTVNLYAANGTTLLVDTDSDGIVDTGAVAVGGSTTIVARVTVPVMAAVGDANSMSIVVRSSRDTSKSKTVSLQTAIPAPFAQTYRDAADGTISLYLARSKGAFSLQAPGTNFGSDLSIAETLEGNFISAWSSYRWTGSAGVNEIYYMLASSCGQSLGGVKRLTDHSGATMSTYDLQPVLAVAPNGRIGILWRRYYYDYSSNVSRYLYNLYYAVIDRSGNFVILPTNLTNNTEWYQSNPPTYNVPRFWNPRIVATGDNRFVMAWEQEHQETNGWVTDIYYAVRDTSGVQIHSVTKLTSSTPGDIAYIQPALTSIASNHVLLTWMRRVSGYGDVYYVVIASNGAIVKSATDLSSDATGTDWRNWDVVQLSNGRIAVFWEAWGCFPGEWVPRIRFAVLDAAYNRVVAPVCLPAHPSAVNGEQYVSATADNNGRAILTWMDQDQRNLYYALINGYGTVLTEPMIFMMSKAANPFILTSYIGYGNTSYSQAYALMCRNYLPLALRNHIDYFAGPWEVEPNDTWQQANGPLISGRDYYGYPNDARDYFSIYMRQAGAITVNLTGHTGTGVQLQLWHGPPQADGSNRVAFKTQAPYQLTHTGPAGWYYVYIYTAGGYNSNTPYTLQVTYGP